MPVRTARSSVGFGSKRRCAMTMGDEETRGVLDIVDHALKRGMDSRARNRY